VTIEDAVHEFIQEAIEAAQDGDVLFNAELHDNAYLTITKDSGIRLGDCTSDAAPLPGGEEMAEFDAYLPICFFSRIEGTDKTDRKAARNKARALWFAVALLFHNDRTLGGRVRDIIMRRAVTGYDSITDGDFYAVVNLPLIVNSTGQQLEEERSSYE